VALLAPLFAFIGRQIGRVVQTAFGWATVLLFGRVPQRKQLLLAGVSLASILWVVTLFGVLLPDLGSWIIAFVPAPEFIGEDAVRIVMLILAVMLPLLVGLGGLFLMEGEDRPAGIGGKVVQVLRGYPYAAVLSVVILFLLVVAPVFKLRTILKRWDDAHVPIVVKPGGYERVATDLEAAIDAAGLELSRVRAPRVLELPSRLLAVVGGASVRRYVPDRLVMLKGTSLEVTIHPSDVAMTGGKEGVARARAAVADRLTVTQAYLTTSKESQELEDAIGALRADEPGELATARLAEIDQRLATITVPYEDWEVLYRQRLQVERDMLRGERAPAPGEVGERAVAQGEPTGERPFLRRALDRLFGKSAA
jgi:hypothetical protein